METEIADRAILRGLFDTAVEAVSARQCLSPALSRLPPHTRGRTLVLGAGKAAADMALAFEESCGEPSAGLVVTRYGHGAPCRFIEVIEARHPIPDDASHVAATRMLAMVSNLTPDDRVVALMSGGASALLSLPAAGISLADKQAVNRALLRSGAPIGDMNCVRKHLSAIKGGRLAMAASPARVHTYVISDVPGDDPGDVGSGPTIPDATTCGDALGVLARYGVNVASHITDALKRGKLETPKPDRVSLSKNTIDIVATAKDALHAAERRAARLGFLPIILDANAVGEARDVAVRQAETIKQKLSSGINQPLVLLSGGETTVTVKSEGRGGRNAEFLLSLLIATAGIRGVSAIACDTDGIDGSEDNAGCVFGPSTWATAKSREIDAESFLARNDSYSFFEKVGCLIKTGPTRTNVNDFRAIIVR